MPSLESAVLERGTGSVWSWKTLVQPLDVGRSSSLFGMTNPARRRSNPSRSNPSRWNSSSAFSPKPVFDCPNALTLCQSAPVCRDCGTVERYGQSVEPTPDRHRGQSHLAEDCHTEFVPPPDNVLLDDSFVLDVQSDSEQVILKVAAVLTSDHPQFYWPPKPGEQHAYANMTIRIFGTVQWIEGPFPPRTIDASGERDYDDLGSWWTGGDGVEHIDGEWGRVAVHDAHQTIEVGS